MSRRHQPLLPGPAPLPPPRPRPQAHQLRFPRWLIGLLVVVALPALVVIFGVVLLVLDQTELLARIIVGCVLVVVFGTPALCLLAFLICCFWLVARAGRSRRPASRTRREVMFDD